MGAEDRSGVPRGLATGLAMLATLLLALGALGGVSACSDDADGRGGEQPTGPTTSLVAPSTTETPVPADIGAVGGGGTGKPAEPGIDGVSTPQGTAPPGDTSGSTGGPTGGDTAGTIATEVTGALVYADPVHGIAFSYPADWRLTEDISAEGTAGGSAVAGVGAFDPRGAQRDGVLLEGVVVSTYQLGATVDDALLPAFGEEVAALLPQLEAQLTDYLILDPLRQTTVNGIPGFETTYSFTKDGQELRNRLLFLVDGDLEHQITIQGTAAGWDRRRTKFELILGTFRSTR